ncbi:hypothetical protein BpJC7_05170 [Weizmannia acidilactici]|uniref:Membrane protein YqhR n=1 Tax=Weizmannia acidilactici TaxID=2607726 RepID=A0A5J4JJN0_9BACI|nr:YqhR family membrane protein [Weizmannia acidilactici]GER66150.1 hypothetical protein BpJC4_06210 [Weizmannia acidilactici]GER69214.1 hypothetical protein BpJC7_05170 [Weizmannia acidilactici]GER72459.1 hypothetical protein BpPP18_05260 [Weizmannia acidilactici]
MAIGSEKLKYQEHTLTFFQMVIVTGFTGGIIWSVVAYLCFYLHFTTIEPNILLEPFTVGSWRKIWIGKMIAILAYGLISIGVAIVYYLFFKKIKSMWAGAAYGLCLCALVLLVLNPIFPGMKPLLKLDANTITTCACIYILYGVFIGYSISFEYERGQKFKKRVAGQTNTRQ